MQLKSSRAGGKHGIELQEGKLGHAGHFSVLIFYSVLHTCSQLSGHPFLILLCAPLQVPPPIHRSGGDAEGTLFHCLPSSRTGSLAASRTVFWVSHRCAHSPCLKLDSSLHPLSSKYPKDGPSKLPYSATYGHQTPHPDYPSPANFVAFAFLTSPPLLTRPPPRIR